MTHNNEEVVREAYAAFDAGDFEKMASLFADDPVWHVPGRSKLAGEYRGVDVIFGYLGALRRPGRCSSPRVSRVEIRPLGQYVWTTAVTVRFPFTC